MTLEVLKSSYGSALYFVILGGLVSRARVGHIVR